MDLDRHGPRLMSSNCKHLDHREVLSFISSRRNWDSPNPSAAGECAPPPPPVLGGGIHSLAREGLGESQCRRGDIHCGTLYIYVLCDLDPPYFSLPTIFKQLFLLAVSSQHQLPFPFLSSVGRWFLSPPQLPVIHGWWSRVDILQQSSQFSSSCYCRGTRTWSLVNPSKVLPATIMEWSIIRGHWKACSC